MVKPFKFLQFAKLIFYAVFSKNRNAGSHDGFVIGYGHFFPTASTIRKWLLVGFLFFVFIIQAKAQTISVNDSVSLLPQEPYAISALKLLKPEKKKFAKMAGRRINFGLTGNEFYYALLKLEPGQPIRPQYLSIDNTSLDSVFIYEIKPDNSFLELYKGGRLIPYDNRRQFVWHTAQVDFGTKPTYYLLAVKAAEKNINFRYDLLSYSQLQKKYETFERIVFFYVGIAFMILAIIILALFLFKKQVFAVYAGYMVCVSFWIIDHYGYINPYLYPGMPELNDLTKPLSSLGAAFMLLTTQKFIFYNNLQNYAFLFRIVQYLRTYLIFLLLFTTLLFNPTISSTLKISFVILWHSGLIFSVILIAFLPLFFIKTNEVAKIFSIAMLVICLTTLSQFFANIGLIHDYFLNEHGMALGSVIENSIMAFGLLYGLVIERRNKNLQVLTLQNEQKEMLEKLIYVQANERKRIASDLHDNIGPLLAALKINFRRIINLNGENTRHELIEKTESIIDDSITEIRNIAHNLMPKNLESNGLIHTLEDYFLNVQQLYGKQLSFTHEVYSIFKPEMQVNIYFIISELVLNAAKHSTGQLINVSVKSEPRAVSIRVLDNGQGFPAKQIMNHHSFGIQSAESRTNYLKGKFSLKSSAGKGTVVNIKIPLQ